VCRSLRGTDGNWPSNTLFVPQVQHGSAARPSASDFIFLSPLSPDGHPGLMRRTADPLRRFIDLQDLSNTHRLHYRGLTVVAVRHKIAGPWRKLLNALHLMSPDDPAEVEEKRKKKEWEKERAFFSLTFFNFLFLCWVLQGVNDGDAGAAQ
jgi:hypothetical protein